MMSVHLLGGLPLSFCLPLCKHRTVHCLLLLLGLQQQLLLQLLLLLVASVRCGSVRLAIVQVRLTAGHAA